MTVVLAAGAVTEDDLLRFWISLAILLMAAKLLGHVARRLGQPAEIARGVLFLCDPASDYLTGTTLQIDGGINLPVKEMHRLQPPA